MWHVGWFVDMFEITEANGEKVVDPQKLKYIQQMLNVHTLEENYAVSSGTLLDNSLAPITDRAITLFARCVLERGACSLSASLCCIDMFSCKLYHTTARFFSPLVVGWECVKPRGSTVDLPVTNGGAAGMLDDCHSLETTVFELAGQDRAGMLADITDLLSANDCIVRSAAVSASAPFQDSLLRPHPRFGQCINVSAGDC